MKLFDPILTAVAGIAILVALAAILAYHWQPWRDYEPCDHLSRIGTSTFDAVIVAAKCYPDGRVVPNWSSARAKPKS